MGKRTNTILQSAFFKLANIIPIDKAVGYMKDAVKKTYGRKGDDIVNMNFAAIDAGVDALVKIDVPASWANLDTTVTAPEVKGNRPELVKFVKEILMPVNAQKGDSLPVSSFYNNADGLFPSGGSAYEKRGVAVDVPEVDSGKLHPVQSVQFGLPSCNHPSLCHE